MPEAPKTTCTQSLVVVVDVDSQVRYTCPPLQCSLITLEALAKILFKLRLFVVCSLFCSVVEAMDAVNFQTRDRSEQQLGNIRAKTHLNIHFFLKNVHLLFSSTVLLGGQCPRDQCYVIAANITQ